MRKPNIKIALSSSVKLMFLRYSFHGFWLYEGQREGGGREGSGEGAGGGERRRGSCEPVVN